MPYKKYRRREVKQPVDETLFQGRLGDIHKNSGPVDMLDVEFCRVSSLQEIATFQIAIQLWHSDEIEALINEYCPISNNSFSDSPKIEDIIKTVQESLLRWYPRLPTFMANDIIHAIKSIGNEIHFWKKFVALPKKTDIGRISYKDFQWSASRTNNRLKAACVSKNFNFTDTRICRCCWKNYVGSLWKDSAFGSEEFFSRYYGVYKYHARVFERFYVEHFLEIYHLQLFMEPGDTPLENIFYLSVYVVYNEAVEAYWSQMTEEQQKKNLNKAIDIFFDGCSSNTMNERKTSTFMFLWNKLGREKRKEIMEKNFYHVLRILLPWPMTEYLVPVLDSCNTVNYNNPIYFLLLWEAAKKIPRGFHVTDRYRNLFTFLCGRALSVLGVYRAQHLILTLLEFPEDLDMAVKIMAYYNFREKRKFVHELFTYHCEAIRAVLAKAFVKRVRAWPRYTRFKSIQ